MQTMVGIREIDHSMVFFFNKGHFITLKDPVYEYLGCTQPQ
jgi:hypothetical protein